MKFAVKKVDLNTIGDSGVSLLPVEPEDMWHANNLIRPGDVLKAPAMRKVVEETATGSTTSSRVRALLTIRVESTFFDPPKSALQVSGVVIVENAIANTGQYHTLDLELQRAFTLWKQDGWDSVALDELKEALRDDKGDAIAAVVMNDARANVCVITEYQTLIKARVESNIPKKMASTTTTSSEKKEKKEKYFGDVLRALLDATNVAQARMLILASPGYAAQNMRDYMVKEAANTGDAMLRTINQKTQVVHTSTGNVHSLSEALSSPQVAEQLKKSKFHNEASLMDDILAKLRSDNEAISSRVAYGPAPVAYAVDEGAVGRGGGVLLINNALFRSDDIMTRKRYVAIVDKVRESGGEVRLLSSSHESGKRLDGLGGIAALLTYPLQYVLEDNDEEEPGTVTAAAADENRDMVV